MAVYEVSTWTELVNALTTISGSTESQTIKLTSDIDCNYEIPMGVTSTIVSICATTQGNGFIIDGFYEENGVKKHHVIRNLRTDITSTTPVKIFQFSTSGSYANWTIQGIDFINLILDAELMYFGGTTALNECRFIGKRSTILLNQGSLTMTSCFFNVPYEHKSSTETAPNKLHRTSANVEIANFCWFRETAVTDMPANKQNCASFYGMNMNGCYVDGAIMTEPQRSGGVIVGAKLRAITYHNSGFVPAIQNVMDCDIVVPDEVTDASTVAFVETSDNYTKGFGVVKKSIKNISDTVIDTTAWSPTIGAGVILESPADMKNPMKLKNDGFEIVVPT